MTTSLAGKRIKMTKSVNNGVFSPPAKGTATAEPERHKSNQHLRRNPPIAGEAEAIAAAQAGDGAAFERLYSLHKRRVYSLCLRMLGNVAKAEDLTQEAFLQLFRKIGSFRGDSAFSTWLHRLSVNIVLMHFRKKVLAEISLDEPVEPTQEDRPKREIATCDNVLRGSIDRITLERV